MPDDATAGPARLRKLFGNVGVVFKGSGFYRNDSREPVKSSSNGFSGDSESTTSSSSSVSARTRAALQSTAMAPSVNEEVRGPLVGRGALPSGPGRGMAGSISGSGRQGPATWTWS